jgi:hypothetical protein
MKQEQTAEPPSCPQIPLFMVGQDSHGNWVAQDQSGARGGLFVERLDALRYVRSENANRTQAYVAVSGGFELNMTRAISVPHDKSLVEAPRDRKVA